MGGNTEGSKARLLAYADCGLSLTRGPIQVGDNDHSLVLEMRPLTELEEDICGESHGVIIVADRTAKTLDGTLKQALREAREFASVICLANRAPLERIQPLLIYEATPGTQRRPFRHFFYSAGGRFPVQMDKTRTLDLINRIYNGKRRERVLDAVVHTVASAGCEDPIDSFMIAWLALERMNPVFRDVFQLPPSEVHQLACPIPGCEGKIDSPKQIDGTKHFVVEELKSRKDWKKLRELRRDLQHGTTDLDSVRDRALEASSLARRIAVRGLSMILDEPDPLGSLRPHGYARQISIRGAFYTEKLPPQQHGEEPYLRLPELRVEMYGTSQSSSAVMEPGKLVPTFDFSFTFEDLDGISGSVPQRDPQRFL